MVSIEGSCIHIRPSRRSAFYFLCGWLLENGSLFSLSTWSSFVVVGSWDHVYCGEWENITPIKSTFGLQMENRAFTSLILRGGKSTIYPINLFSLMMSMLIISTNKSWVFGFLL